MNLAFKTAIPRYGGIERVVDTITSGLCRTYSHNCFLLS